MGGVTAVMPAGLLADEAVAWPRLGKFLAEDFFRLAVGGGNEIGRPLERDLQMLDLAKVALKPAAGEPCGFDHDIEQGGMEHDLLIWFFGKEVAVAYTPRGLEATLPRLE